ncbi:MAG: methyltransferase domain-containing protein [Methanoregula sp.]|nr:methyltransferase domain-containing protein [Methanoregula sp.]
MQPHIPEPKAHYDRFLAEHYLWMAGGFYENAARSRQFFSAHHIRPVSGGTAIDLGAGCGFQSVPLVEAGFRVTAVDFCEPLLEEIRERVPDHAMEIVTGDILDFPLWAGKKPELITCMGDTLTHLPDIEALSSLLRQCYSELMPGGKLVLSLRDYSLAETGSVAIIPVRHDADRIFLCRLEYLPDNVMVTDILYTRKTGTWERTASAYVKLRISPLQVREMMEQDGFRIDLMATENGMIVFIGTKPAK